MRRRNYDALVLSAEHQATEIGLVRKELKTEVRNVGEALAVLRDDVVREVERIVAEKLAEVATPAALELVKQDVPEVSAPPARRRAPARKVTPRA
jgi:hypothetical protein